MPTINIVVAAEKDANKVANLLFLGCSFWFQREERDSQNLIADSKFFLSKIIIIKSRMKINGAEMREN